MPPKAMERGQPFAGNMKVNENDYAARMQRVQNVDEECETVFEAGLQSTWDGSTSAMVPEEETLIASLPLIAVMGGPFDDGRKHVVGDGSILLTESTAKNEKSGKIEKKHRMIIHMSTTSGSVEGNESWSKVNFRGGGHAQTSFAQYSATHQQDMYVGFINVENDSYLPVQVQTHDEAFLKVIFGGAMLKPTPKDCCDNCCDCTCGFALCGQCMSVCSGCCSCCDPPDQFHGSWSFNADFVQSLKQQIIMRIQASTGNADYKFPDFENVNNPEERAILLQFTRAIKFKYWNFDTGRIQPCTVIVQPDVQFSQICAFASKVQFYSVDDRDTGRRS